MRELDIASMEMKKQMAAIDATKKANRRDEAVEMSSINRMMNEGEELRAQIRKQIHSALDMIREDERQTEQLLHQKTTLEQRMKKAAEKRKELRSKLEAIMQEVGDRNWQEITTEKFPNLNVEDTQLWYQLIEERFPLITQGEHQSERLRNVATALEAEMAESAQRRASQATNLNAIDAESSQSRAATTAEASGTGKQASAVIALEESSTDAAKAAAGTKATKKRVQFDLAPPSNLKGVWYKERTWSNMSYKARAEKAQTPKSTPANGGIRATGNTQ
jgi:hypothetical protein